jgi:signal transduction histidine kinase
MSDRRLRLVAWSLFGVLAGGFVSGGVFGVLNHSPLWSGENVQLIGFAGMGVIGLLVSLRRPRNAVGWIFSALGAWIGVLAFAEGYSRYALVTHPGALPGGIYVGWFYQWAWFPWLFCLLTLPFLVFPDGRLPSRRWRPVLWASAGIAAVGWIPLALSPDIEEFKVANPFGLPNAKATIDLLFGATFVFLPILAILAVSSLLIRFRDAQIDERQQIKWVMFAGALLVAGAGVGIGFDAAGIQLPGIVFSTLLALLPASIGLAILKYRLYDIDVVINKTLVYGLLAAFITAVYVGIVVGIGQAIGSKRNLGLSILATAVVAVGFQPVRDRVQHLANRLVYGKRATPYEVLSEFSGRMSGAYATEDLLPRMARILAEGTGAARADVWLRVGTGLHPEASWPSEGEPHDPVRIMDGEFPQIEGVDRALPVRHRGELLGALSVTKSRADPLRPAEEKLMEDLASGAGLVLRNVRLTAELLARLDELKASRQRIVAAQDEERRKLERNLHDGAQQQLVALQVRLSLAERVAEEGCRVKDSLVSLKQEANEALENLRDLARGIYPPLLADQGLAAALQAQARKAAVPVAVITEGLARYPQDQEAAVYFCVLEALQNVAKYAGASEATIRLHEADGELTFEVRDDGAGFDTTTTSYGTGLQGMADRLSAQGGTLEVRSVPGQGTMVTGRIPVRMMEPVSA